MENEKELENLWLEKYDTALANMNDNGKRKGILIETAAQHPLKDGKYPNEEFEKRLNLAINLYKKNIGNNTVKIYVPGSRHKDNGKTDEISLSEAGKQYLISKGIPAEDIYAEDANMEFMGEKGVYNSTDECYVSCMLFKKYEFKELHLVCSPNQMMRKLLCYINFGYIPDIHTASCKKMYHNPVREIFECIPAVLKNDKASEDIIRNSRRT